ncbi:Transcription factor Iwr1 [Phytophthora cactorum]|nr:Transcription factor Iwr1 [Phytophthora cactorum]
MVEDKKSPGMAPSIAAARAARATKDKPDAHEKPIVRVFATEAQAHGRPDGVSGALQDGPAPAFTNLSTTEKRFVFKHIDTMEEPIASGRVKWTERLKRKARSLKDERADMMAKKQLVPVFQKDPTASKQTERRVKQQQSRSKARRKEEILKSRGLQPVVEIKEKQTMELHGIRLVDLQMSAAPSTCTQKETDEEILEKSKADVVTINGAKLKPTRVLNPHERELDEAIWTAFRANDFAPFFQIYHARRPELRVNPTTFQRPADGSSILMAAALHGRSDVIEVLLRSEAEHEKDYVYDVYCVDISASEGQDSAHDAATSSEDGSEQTSVNGVPVVSVSSEVHRWLSEDMPSEAVEEYMLESDIDSNEEDDGLSEDSNDEDNEANDYPDEESSDESLADSEDLDEIGARRRWQTSENDHTERDDFDY